MADCKSCEYETMCTIPDFIRNDLKNCKVYEPKKNRTNADRIRSMSDEELAELFTKLAWNSEVQTTPLKYLEWLQSEVE